MGIYKLHTPLEEKLFEYIKFLLGVINVLTYYFVTINTILPKWANTVNEDFLTMDFSTKNKELTEFLNKEFDWDGKVIPVEEK